MDDGSSPLWTGIVLILFVIINGILYGFGSAIQKVSESEIEKKAQEGDEKSQWLLSVIDSPARVINTTLISSVFFAVLSGYVGIHKIVPALEDVLRNIDFFASMSKKVQAVLCAAFVLFVMVGILVAIGMISFKKVSVKEPMKWVYRTEKTVKLLITLFTPLTFFTIKLSNGCVRLFGIDPHKSEEDVTEEEIISIVDDAHEQGVIEESEAEMIQNIIEFSDKEAQDIMTHRKNINAIDEKTPLKEALTLMLNGSNSRYPVYRDDIDDIIGILHLKDAMKEMMFENHAEETVGRIPNLIRDASYIPETRSINDLFKRMQAKKLHMAIVVDEYGQTSGIVTMEDILEEIVGNILDEYDEDDHFITEQLDNTYLMKGLTPLEDVEETLSIDLQEEEYETLNGYLTSLLGHIPNIDEDKEIRAKKLHMAIVVDEYGQTSGIVTMEDILEEIVGNILDEYDEDDHFITEQLDNTYLMKGLTPLEDVEETLSIDLQEEEYETLNGYLTSLLGHIPNIDEDKEIRANGYLFTILAVENNTIQRVRVEKLPEEKGEEKCQDIQNSQT